MHSERLPSERSFRAVASEASTLCNRFLTLRLRDGIPCRLMMKHGRNRTPGALATTRPLARASFSAASNRPIAAPHAPFGAGSSVTPASTARAAPVQPAVHAAPATTTAKTDPIGARMGTSRIVLSGGAARIPYARGVSARSPRRRNSQVSIDLCVCCQLCDYRERGHCWRLRYAPDFECGKRKVLTKPCSVSTVRELPAAWYVRSPNLGVGDPVQLSSG